MIETAVGATSIKWHVAPLLPGYPPITTFDKAELSTEQQVFAACATGYTAITDGLAIRVVGPKPQGPGVPDSAIIHVPLLPPSQAQHTRRPASQGIQGPQATISCLAWSQALPHSSSRHAACSMLAAACGTAVHVFAVGGHGSCSISQPVWLGSVDVKAPSGQVTSMAWHPTLPNVLACITQDELFLVQVLRTITGATDDMLCAAHDCAQGQPITDGQTSSTGYCELSAEAGTGAGSSPALYGSVQLLASQAACADQGIPAGSCQMDHGQKTRVTSGRAVSCVTWLDMSCSSSMEPSHGQQAELRGYNPQAYVQPRLTPAGHHVGAAQAGQRESSLLAVCWGGAAAGELQLLLWCHQACVSSSTSSSSSDMPAASNSSGLPIDGNGGSNSSAAGSTHATGLQQVVRKPSCKWQCISQQTLLIDELLADDSSGARYNSTQGTERSFAAADLRIRAMHALTGTQLLVSVESATLPVHATADITPSSAANSFGDRVKDRKQAADSLGQVSAPVDLRGKLGSAAAQARTPNSLLPPDEEGALSFPSGLLLPGGGLLGLNQGPGVQVPSVLHRLVDSHTSSKVPSSLLLHKQQAPGLQPTGRLLLIDVSVQHMCMQPASAVEGNVVAGLLAAGVTVPAWSADLPAKNGTASNAAAIKAQVRRCAPLHVPHANLLTATSLPPTLRGKSNGGEAQPDTTSKALVAVGSTTTPAILQAFQLVIPNQLDEPLEVQSLGFLSLGGHAGNSTYTGVQAQDVPDCRIRGALFRRSQRAGNMEVTLQVLHGNTMAAGTAGAAPFTFLRRKGPVTSQLHDLQLAQYALPASLYGAVCEGLGPQHLSAHGTVVTSMVVCSEKVEHEQQRLASSNKTAALSTQNHASHSSVHISSTASIHAGGHAGSNQVNTVQSITSFDLLFAALKQHVDQRFSMLQTKLQAGLEQINQRLSHLEARDFYP